MKFLVKLLAVVAAANTFPNYIIKYESGKVEKSAADPRKSFVAFSFADDSDPVEYIEEDTTLRAHAYSYNDSMYSQQWALTNYHSSTFVQAKTYVNSYSSANVDIAVVDTGITNHSDINHSIIGGADLISSSQNASDGNGRDSDASDVGDYNNGTMDCAANSRSTWHGTHITGIISAKENNYYGIAGSGTNHRVVPVRVLGQCGGLTSDIADGVRWAVGGSVSGLPVNPNPVKVLNLSLGAQGSCSRYMQEAIDYAKSKGAVVVVSAGNSAANASYFTPANCRGVLRVGAVDSRLSQSSYSNYGNIVDISAPGDAIFSTVNAGQTYPSYESFSSMSGTSMAAGFVSSTAAMIYSINPGLYPDQVRGIIKDTAAEIYCRLGQCSGGTIDPYQAVRLAQSTSPDSSYVYDDAVLFGGTSELNTTSSSNGGGGGACGTIAKKGSSKQDTSHFLGLFFLIGLVIAHSYKSSLLKSIT